MVILNTPMSSGDERVLVAAARLFSMLGYDATTLSMVKEAAGHRAEDSILLKAGKGELYHSVLRRLHAMEMERLELAVKAGDGGVAGLHSLVDAFFDFVVEHPEFASMWWQRGLKDAAELPFSPEEEFPPPLMTFMTPNSWPRITGSLDLKFLAWCVMWAVSGFVNSGFPDESGRRVYPDHESAVDLFRVRLHELVDRCV
ncbi:TetR/AcrR family transcriptional regulator [Spirillospora sp. NPDC046719]